MRRLFRYLREAVRQWRSEKRDYELMRIALQYPARRRRAVELASFDARFFMLALGQFAYSDLQVAQVQLKYTIASPWDEGPLPPPMCRKWSQLIMAAIFDTAGKGDGCPFTFITEKGPVPIYVSESLPVLPATPSDDLGESLMKALLDQPPTFTFSKEPPPLR